MKTKRTLFGVGLFLFFIVVTIAPYFLGRWIISSAIEGRTEDIFVLVLISWAIGFLVELVFMIVLLSIARVISFIRFGGYNGIDRD